jgi:single-stranded DNA-binding protein
MNNCTLVGTLERAPRLLEADGPVQALFTLRIDETGKDGRTFQLYVPIEAYGTLANQAGTWEAGSLVALTGKLKWRSSVDAKGEKKSGLCIFAKEARVLEPVDVVTE